jgi:hypothetical protein
LIISVLTAKQSYSQPSWGKKIIAYSKNQLNASHCKVLTADLTIIFINKTHDHYLLNYFFVKKSNYMLKIKKIKDTNLPAVALVIAVKNIIVLRTILSHTA